MFESDSKLCNIYLIKEIKIKILKKLASNTNIADLNFFCKNAKIQGTKYKMKQKHFSSRRI